MDVILHLACIHHQYIIIDSTHMCMDKKHDTLDCTFWLSYKFKGYNLSAPLWKQKQRFFFFYK